MKTSFTGYLFLLTKRDLFTSEYAIAFAKRKGFPSEVPFEADLNENSG